MKKILIVIWLGLLFFSGSYLLQSFSLTTNITQFLPDAVTAEQQFAIEQIQSGLSQKVILLTISGQSAENLADISRVLVNKLAIHHLISGAYNGSTSQFDIANFAEDNLFLYRYLLDSELPSTLLDVSALQEAIDVVHITLASPFAEDLLNLLKADPTQHYLSLLEKINPLNIQSQQGVWFSVDGEHALILVVTNAPGFDTSTQSQVIAEINQVASEYAISDVSIDMTGPGVIAVNMREQITQEASYLSVFAFTFLIVFLWASFRNSRVIFLLFMPLLSGVMAAITAVLFFHGEIHGLTLAFGVTLLGIAVDYPIHILMEKEAGRYQVSLSLRRTLFFSFLTTVVAFSVMLLTDFSGLRQLGLFILIGLTVAFLVARWIVPNISMKAFRMSVPGIIEPIMRLRGRWQWLVYVLLTFAIIGFYYQKYPLWDDSLSAMQPVPAVLLAKDHEMREQFSMPNLQTYFLVQKQDEQSLLETLELLKPELEQLKQANIISDYDLLSDWLPSYKQQKSRQMQLADKEKLLKILQNILARSPLNPDFFQPFLDSVDRNQSLMLIDSQHVPSILLQQRIDGLLAIKDKNWQAKIPLTNVKAKSDLQSLINICQPDCYFLPLQTLSMNMLKDYRQQLMLYLAIAAIVLIIFLNLMLSSALQAWQVISSLATSIIFSVAVLTYLHGALNLMHVLGMLLVLGLGLDYAFFLVRPVTNLQNARRSIFGLIICVVSTLIVFGLLSFAETQVLKNLGQAVFIGTMTTFSLLYLVILPEKSYQETNEINNCN